ncbi:MAG TPA: PaaI family thioesterase [Pseudomonadales bacterium]
MAETREIPFDAEIARRFLGPPKGGGGLPEYLGFELVDAGPGWLLGRMAVRTDLLTPFGNLHGGVLSAFCDHMLGCVCYPAMRKGQWAATTEFKINLTAPVTTGTLEARAEIINLTRTQAVVRIDVRNEGRLAAVAQGTVTIRDPR